MVAGSTAAIAWLLDPAIKKMFIEQDTTMILLIPIAIVLAFACKGLSLYLARVVLIKVGGSIVFYPSKTARFVNINIRYSHIRVKTLGAISFSYYVCCWSGQYFSQQWSVKHNER